jgi:hypothetical protein
LSCYHLLIGTSQFSILNVGSGYSRVSSSEGGAAAVETARVSSSSTRSPEAGPSAICLESNMLHMHAHDIKRDAPCCIPSPSLGLVEHPVAVCRQAPSSTFP